jgi:hypothetical protein
MQPKLMHIELGKLTKPLESILMSKKNGKQRTPEEVTMLRNVPPATSSMHIKNTYELNVNVKFSGLDCCSAHPSISVPMTIIPIQDPAVYGFPEPAGFAPADLGYFQCALQVVPYDWQPQRKVEVTVHGEPVIYHE